MGKLGDVAMCICPMCGKENGEIAIATRNYRGDIQKNAPVGQGLCEACQAMVDVAANIECANCGEIIAKLEAGIMPNGFVIEEKATYHSESCPKCNPQIKGFALVELKEYLESQKVAEEMGGNE